MPDEAVQAAPLIDLLAIAAEQSDRRTKLHRFTHSIFASPDLEAIDILYAICRAHFFTGTKPVSLWLTGASGSGKTELGIRLLECLPHTYQVGDLTTKSLISARRGAQGILHQLVKDKNDHYSGILLFKDFTSFLSKRADDRTEIAAQIREIADGAWSRNTGERGKSRIEWKGKVSIIAACTPILEAYWATLKIMGDRQLTIRWHEPSDRDCCSRVNEHDGKEDQIRATLYGLSKAYFGVPVPGPPPPLPISFDECLTEMSILSCWLRQPVHRDAYKDVVDDVSPREKPTRTLKSLRMVLAGHSAMLGRPIGPLDLKIAYRLAFDSVAVRRMAIVNSLQPGLEVTLPEVAEMTNEPYASIRREAQNLDAIGVVKLSKVTIDGVDKSLIILTDKFADAHDQVKETFKKVSLE